jgi:hypothetical protein
MPRGVLDNVSAHARTLNPPPPKKTKKTAIVIIVDVVVDIIVDVVVIDVVIRGGKIDFFSSMKTK